LKILLAVDNSRQAKEAARSVRDCFPGSEIELLHVLDIEAAPHSHLSAALIDEQHRKIRSRLWTDANRFLPKFVALFARMSRKVRVVVKEGHASDVILQMASASPPDLIVLGSRGLSELQAFVLGAVSYRVAHEAPCPVLLIKHALPPVPKILLAVDGSQGAQRAVRFVAGSSLFASSHVVVLTVGSPTRELHEYVSTVVSELSSRGHTVDARVLQGGPAATILQRARDEGIDLIITGSRELRGWLHPWLWSISRKIIMHATISVLIVHGTAPENKEEDVE
jgi:nucleotide-binding universal stress UspA family protein